MTDVPSSSRVAITAWRGAPAPATRLLPEEVAVAMTYDRVTFAVMMASPADLQDFAVGFSISEGIITSPSEILEFEAVTLPAGIECRMALTPARRQGLEARRRRIAGPVGCGLCGMDSLAEAVKSPATIASELVVTAKAIAEAVARLPTLQSLNLQTHAVHAAACFHPGSGEFLVREDIGRHNALDKLIGAVKTSVLDPASCIVLLTSRVSIDLIQKTAALGCAILVAVSVPTARAVRDAEATGITLVAVARNDGFEVFSHPERIIGSAVRT